ncbi:FG-GAP-like repeat-containing protein [Fimbriiglobus ruber]|nr:FG-GAP-like repeat-containing protein [Fimbriiglobus ruber]
MIQRVGRGQHKQNRSPSMTVLQLEDRSVPATFTAGSIQGQDGWTGGTAAISTNVVQTVDQSGANAFSGTGAWLVSNSTANGGYNGNFVGWPFSPGLSVTAGDPSSGAGADTFTATLYFKSASSAADGSNIEVDLGSAAGDDRTNFLALTNEDDANGGLQIRAAEPMTDGTTNFYPTVSIATDITRATYHRLDVTANYADGTDNDTFTVSLDGKVLTNPRTGGTTFGTFEAYEAAASPPASPPNYEQTSRLLFRSGTAPSGFDALTSPGEFSDTGAQGFYFDNVSYRDYNQSDPSATLASYAATFETQPAVTYANPAWSSLATGDPITDADPLTAGDQPATYGVNAFATITDAVTAVAAGGTVIANAGTYAENVTINKPLTLEGQSSTNTVIEPGLTSSYNTDNVVTVLANNVTVEGFTIQGSITGTPPVGQSSGFTLSSGTTVYAAAGISNSADVTSTATDISGLTVQNNVIKDFTQFGVDGDTSSGAVSTGNTIANNVIQDIPENNPGSGFYGQGVVVADNFYAAITGNTITNVRTGIQTDNNYTSAGAFAPSISNNIVSATVKGIYLNLQYSAASPFAITGNTITQADGTVSPAYNVGLLVQSIYNGVTTNIQGNNVSGFLYGVEFAGNSATTPVEVQGGTLSGNTYGVWATNNDYFYPANFNTTAALSGVAITDSKTAAIWVDSTSQSMAGTSDTTDTVSLAVGGGTTVTGGPTGLLIAGSLSNITGNALGTVSFAGVSGDDITLAAGALVGQTLDATAATYDGVVGTAATPTQGYAIADKVTDYIDNPALGFVRITPATVYVTPKSESTTAGAVQRGVTAAANNDTVDVAAGTYAENVTINKPLTLEGESSANTVIEPGLTSSYNTDNVVTVLANDVTVEGFTIQGSITGTPPVGQSSGFTLSSGTTVYAAAGISNSADVTSTATDISGLTVQNNVIKDFTQFGVDGDTSSGAVSTGNTIANNVIQDIPENNPGSGFYGQGVVVADNFYAAITGNTITNVRTGIQTDNNYTSAGAFAPSISNNIVSATVKGIYLNLQYSAASPFAITGNTITQADGTVSPAYNVGLLVQSIYNGVTTNIQGNNVSGFLYGVEFAGNSATTPVEVQGGTLSGNTYGVWATNNDYFYPANFNTTAALSGVAITDSKTAAIWVDSTSQSMAGTSDTTDSVSLAVGGGTSVTGGPTGLLIAGGLSNITGNALGTVSFAGVTGDDITLAAGALAGQTLDATGVTFNGTTGSTATPAQDYAIADKITDFIDDPTLGFVQITPATVYVTPKSEATTAGAIPRAVTVASAGDTIDVAAGTYTGNIDLSKNVSVRIDGPSSLTGAISGTTGSITDTLGAVSLGDGSAAGVATSSTLDVNGQTVTLLDSDGADLDGETDLVGGTLVSANGINVGGTLAGPGTVGAATIQAGGNVEPGGSGTGILNTGNIAFAAGATLTPTLKGTTAGTTYDQVNTTGTVDLGGATLNLNLAFTPAAGDTFTIVNNDGTDPVVGTFAGLPEGSVFKVGSQFFQISYKGGDGNDVTLKAVPSSVLISAPSAAFANDTSTITYTVTYADPNFASSTLSSGDVTLNTTGTAAVGSVVVSGTGATRTVTLSNITGDGAVGISLPAGTGTDTSSNPEPGAGPSATFTADSTAPTVAIGAPSAAFANGTSTVTYTITYTDTNFADSTLTPGDVTLNATGDANATISIDSGTGATRTVTLTHVTGTGTLGISLLADTAVDSAGNEAPAAGPSGTFTADTTNPTVVIGAPSAATANAGSTITYTITYSDTNFDQSTLTAADVTLNTTGTASATVTVDGGAGATRTVTLTHITGDGTLGISLAAGTAHDLAGNEAPVAGPSGTFTVDTTAPTVAIGAPSAALANAASTVTFTVTYADANFAASTLTAADVTLNTTGTAAGTVSVSGSGTTWTVTVTGITGDGTLGISLAAGTASDTAGNLAPAAGPSATFTVDDTAPTVSISPPSVTVANGSSTVTYTVTYADANFADSTLTAADVTLNATGTASATVSVDSGSGTTRTVTLTHITGDGTLGISLAAGTAHDQLSDPAPAAGPSGTFAVDTTAPTVAIGNPSVAITNGSSTVTYTITYSDANFAASTLTAADVTLNTTGTATATVSVDSGTGTTRTITLSNITGDGTLGISLVAGTASDAAENLAPAAGPSGTFAVDTTAPTVTISSPAVTGAGAAEVVTYTITYADANFADSTLTAADVTLNATGGTTASVAVSGTGTTRTVTLTHITGSGTVGISLVSGTAVDTAGNLAPAAGPSATAAAVPVDANAVGQFAASPDAGGSGIVTVYNADGSVAYTVNPFPGVGAQTGVRAVMAGVTGSATPDVIAGTGPGVRAQVVVVSGTTHAVVMTLNPFEDSFTGGVFVAAADLNGDGHADIVVSPDVGGGGRITVYDGATGQVIANFFGIDDPAFRGGARVSFGDVNGDGVPDLIVSAGTGGGPRVAIFDGRSIGLGKTPTKLVADFFAFEPSLRNGAYVAAGDFNGDGYADLVAGGGPDGAPRVEVLDGASLLSSNGQAPTMVANFFAGDPSLRSGARVAVKNLDGDGSADLVVGLATGTGTQVATYLGKDLTASGTPTAAAELDPFPGFTGGVFVG